MFETHRPPLRFLITIIIAIFAAEVVAMIAVTALPSRPYYQITLIDAGIMVILIFPVLYFLSFRPLLQHIEKSHQAEDRLLQVNRALSVLNECNQVLVRSENEAELLGQMCEIIVKTGGYRMAWVGFAEQDEARSVRPAAQFGFEDGYLDSAKISWSDNDRGRGPTGTAIRQGVVQVNQNFLTNLKMAPWRESALLRGFQSSIALPLQGENSTFGALTIYSASPESFNGEEVHLLQELANDLAFGIIALRVRAERDRAHEQIREMALFPIFNPNAVVRVGTSGQVTMANPAAEEIGLYIGAQLTDVVPSLRDVDIATCIATGSTQQIPEAYLGERVLQWTIHGAPELGLAFLYSTDITLRKQAEDLNRQLSGIVEQTEDSVVVTNCDGIIEYVNPAFGRLTGYTQKEVVGKTPRILKSGIHDEPFYHELWNTILKGNVFLAEVANRKKNGELFYEVKTITPLRDAQGRITHFVATGKDITEHKHDEEELLKAYDDLEMRVQSRTQELREANAELQEEIFERQRAEEALRHSEELLNQAQEIAHLGSWELDLVNNRLAWSDEVYRIFGLQPQEFGATYEAFLDIVYPEDRGAVDEAYSSSVRDGKAGYEMEHRIIRRANGEVRILHEKCEHFRNETGEIIRSVGMVHDISERKHTEEQLRYQAALLSNVNDAIIASDAQFHITAWNAAAESLYGWKAEEAIGSNGVELVRTEWPEKDAHEMRRMIDETGRWRGEATQIRKDGSRFPVEVSSMVLRDNGGQITGYISANHDITERKKAEEALRRSEASLLQTGEMAKVGGWELDPVTMTGVWSLETYRIHEVDPSVQPNVETAINFYAPESRPLITEAVRRAIGEGEPYDLELQLITAKGNQIWIRTIGQAEFQDGKCVRLFGAIQDITERKQAEEILQQVYAGLEQRVQERTEELATANQNLLREIAERKEVERQLRIRSTAMEAAANGIVITDRKGNIQWTNPALVQITGYEKADLVGQNMRIFQSGQQDKAYYRKMWNTILSGEVWQGELTNRRKDGRLYIEEQTIAPVRGDQDEITQFIAIKQDITERKQTEKEIREQNQKEKILSQTIHTMQLDIARDLHDTIGQNVSFLRMRLDYLVGTKKIKQAHMRTEIQNMAKAANDSYDLMRGTLAILQSEDSTDLYRLFTRYAQQIEERSCFKMSSSSQGEPRFMSAKRMRQLFYIFREILSNVEKHAGADQASMEMCWDSDHLHLIVSDNGKGFDISQIPPASHYGLRFMKERVELLNGSLTIHSIVGSGTRVEIEIPYEQT